MRYLTI